MATENQIDTMFAGNRHVMQWAGILDEDGTSIKDLTGLIVKFALTRQGSGGPVLSPILDFRSDVSSQVTIPNPITGSAHVEVEILPVDTATLAPVSTIYYWELEVFEAGDTNGVVVATGTITIKPNVENA
tara:strand:- start:1353 stop:1742 length:390 start_codon:yes stop_codon:yes gene_type:complete